jgi:hypothetical protein
MGQIRRSFAAVLLLLAIGTVTGCPGDEENEGSPPPLPESDNLRLQQTSTGLSSPVFMTAPADDLTRLFIVEQGGRIRIFNVTTKSLLAAPFLNISGLISAGGEEGLLGMAFDPAHGSNGRFYVFYNDTSGNLVVARYQTVW